jgi:hypothetical protein
MTVCMTRRRKACRMALAYPMLLQLMLLLKYVNKSDCRFLFFEYLALSIFVYFGILSICITPNMPVAYMFSGTIYFSECYATGVKPPSGQPPLGLHVLLSLLTPMLKGTRFPRIYDSPSPVLLLPSAVFSLMCGFIIAEPDFPGWWVWLYYLNPVSWLLYGGFPVNSYPAGWLAGHRALIASHQHGRHRTHGPVTEPFAVGCRFRGQPAWTGHGSVHYGEHPQADQYCRRRNGSHLRCTAPI